MRYQAKFVLLISARKIFGIERHSVDFKRRDFIQACALEHTLGIAGVKAERIEAAGFSIGVKRHFVAVAKAKFLDEHFQRSS